ncbi:MAG: hypothetical protein ABIJ46_00355 [bacterium]
MEEINQNFSPARKDGKHAALLVIGVAILLLSVANLIGLFMVGAPETEQGSAAGESLVRHNCEQSGGSFVDGSCACLPVRDGEAMRNFEYQAGTGNCVDEFGLPGGELGELERRLAEAELAETESVRTFENGGLSFSYPNGWHVSASFDYEAQGGEQHTVYLSRDPLQVVTPSDSGVRYHIVMRSYHAGDAILAHYEKQSVDYWDTYESDDIMIGGKKFTRLRLSTDEPFWAPYQEVVFVSGDGDLGFEVVYEYSDPAEAEDPDWLLIRDSLQVR